MATIKTKDVYKYTVKLVKEGRAAYAIPEGLKKIERSMNAPEVIESALKVSQWHNEKMGFIALNAQSDIIGIHIITEGTINQSAVYPREVILRALLHNAASIILFHNHPGGSIRPSRADIEVTERIKEACATVDIQLHDHIIMTESVFVYYSFAEGGLL